MSLWCDRPPSRREIEVAALVARDWSNKQIARELGMAEATVKTHLYRLGQKLSVSSRVGVALWYVRTQEGRRRVPRGDWGVSV
jgi:DNA-binding NarL/FixJ family response regulator